MADEEETNRCREWKDEEHPRTRGGRVGPVRVLFFSPPVLKKWGGIHFSSLNTHARSHAAFLLSTRLKMGVELSSVDCLLDYYEGILDCRLRQ